MAATESESLMTHDELIKKVQSNYEENKHFRDQPDWKSFSALRAVIELHGEVDGGCRTCRADYWAEDYPCRTIEIIEEELK